MKTGFGDVGLWGCGNKEIIEIEMATVKVKFRPSSIAGREGSIYYQIIHERTIRQYLTDYSVLPSEWDEERSTVGFAINGDRRSHILSIRERIKCDVERWDRIIRRMDAEMTPYTTDRLIDEYNRTANENTLFNFMEKSIVRLKEIGRLRTSETYAAALSSFRKYRQGNDIMMESLSSDVMEGYQGWLQQRGSAQNTVSFYIRILRAVYNRAVEEELTENRRPFRHVFTGVDKTVKRALPISLLRKIRKLDLSLTPRLEFARDMFILSFMLRGMSFIDMAYLRKTDLINGHITYRRRKTRQQLTIAWTSDMQEILERYPENTNEYLLPIIKNHGTNERCVVKNVGEQINLSLKKIGVMVGIGVPLTMYVARHSWASIAKSRGVPVSVISEGLGHEKESTTRIYLAHLDSTVVDKANRMILKLL